MEKVLSFIVGSISTLGYMGIVFLMVLESSFFPFPSEVVVPPAGYLSAKGEMNLVLVIISGIVGSILGALFNYYIAVKFGRNFLIKYGKYMFLDEKKLKKIETYFNNHGEITTFVGRLLPGIRQYISFPAGLAKMNLTKFIIYTGLGAGIWVIILAYVGYFVGNNMEMVKNSLHKVTFFMIPLILLIVALYIYMKRRKTS